jgi:hypothetical protein
VDAPREGEASSSDDAAPVEDRVVICDACCACKPQLKNAARTARLPPLAVVSKFTAHSRLSASERATQVAGALAEKDASIVALNQQIAQMKTEISSTGAFIRTPNNKTEEGLFNMMGELRELLEDGSTDPSKITTENYAMLRAQEELTVEYRKRHGTLNGMRWSPRTLVKAWQLLAGSTAKYEWLRESGLVSLPSVTLLQSTFGSNDVTGHARERYERLRARTLHLQGPQAYGALNRDEMKIEEGLVLRKMEGDEWAFIG